MNISSIKQHELPLVARKKRVLSGNPARVVDGFFLLLFILSGLLFLDQAQLFHHGYQASQLAQLDHIAGQLDNFFQRHLDQLHYMQSGFMDRLQNSGQPDRDWLTRIKVSGKGESWELLTPSSRLSGHGVPPSPHASEGLSELAAIQFLQNTLFNHHTPVVEQPHFYYASRNGYQLVSSPSVEDKLPPAVILDHADGVPLDKALWRASEKGTASPMLFATLPVSERSNWIGSLSVGFGAKLLQKLLLRATGNETHANLILFDHHTATFTSALEGANTHHYFRHRDFLHLQETIRARRDGTLQIGKYFVTFTHRDNLPGPLIFVQTIDQVLKDGYGRYYMLPLVLWLALSALLLLARHTFSRIINRMIRQQANIHWQANHDMLTSVFNRRGFYTLASERQLSSPPKSEQMALLLIDLDHFKQINDSYGHAAGDLVLKCAAAAMQNSLRRRDMVGRIGGEEFCVLLPDCTLKDAAVLAERLRKNVASQPVRLQTGELVTVSVSVGVAHGSEAIPPSLDSLQSLADRRLYSAKREGRNRICWGASMHEAPVIEQA
ncbi:hypothetical protein NG99_17140 [Erwinia typographi]|uniref:diguanylate cyclase n=1 Tax=Erwinia typographi TaxID=371042 RepID=A0A0A3YZW9_9GAMM|nr:diguanylate cyclase [Erwinia typographi]KGT91019.1 hypothetical protein NG99_17140 [Erwinia typographi]